MVIETITPKQLFDQFQEGKKLDVIDVRTPVEYRESHVKFARNVPLDQLDASKLLQERANSSEPLYVICRSGSRGRQACEKLNAAAGLTKVINVEGGTLAWGQAGFPVVCGKKTISLERQVRIAAGMLVLVGSFLGAFVSLYWFGLSAFVGAGLVFAGITDTCGMGLLLAKMPWNQVPSGNDVSCPR